MITNRKIDLFSSRLNDHYLNWSTETLTLISDLESADARFYFHCTSCKFQISTREEATFRNSFILICKS
jgi:hypothetical protein